MKAIFVKNGKNGFTLVEIMIVVVIIAILVGIAVPIFVDVADGARHAVWKYNSTYVVKVVALNIANYEPGQRYSEPVGVGGGYSEDSLRNFLLKELEYYQVDDNKDKIVNPRSRSRKVLNAENPSGGNVSDGKNAAVFITGNSGYSHGGSGSTDNLLGTIVAYFNQADPYNVQVYYVDGDGVKSEKIADFK